jgi:uncharacterized membrane protein SpoIIM required for sporulation
MLEMILSPRKAEKYSWGMFLIGLFYSALSVLLVRFFFARDMVMAKHMGILIVTFTVMFCIPFVYFLFKVEERKDLVYKGIFRVFKSHKKGVIALMFLFIGLLIGYSIMYIGLDKQNFAAQIETYCSINRPSNFDSCVNQYVFENSKITGNFASADRFLAIFSNNVYVLIFTIVFSLIFGAGGIFILAWNASVIAAAIGIYTKSQLNQLFIGLSRYMIHGIPEIAAYFLGLVAGGILSVAIIRGDYKGDKFWDIIQDVLNLVIAAVIILVIAGVIEVYITPILF